MVDPLKLRDMISLAEFEDGGRQDMNIYGTGRWNYILFALIRTFILTALAVFLAAGLFVFVNFDSVMDYVTGKDLVRIGVYVGIAFLAVELIWLLIAGILAGLRFSEAEKRVRLYTKTIQELCDYTELGVFEEDEEDEDEDEDEDNEEDQDEG